MWVWKQQIVLDFGVLPLVLLVFVLAQLPFLLQQFHARAGQGGDWGSLYPPPPFPANGLSNEQLMFRPYEFGTEFQSA